MKRKFTNEELIIKAKQGCEESKELLFTLNQGFINDTVSKFRNVDKIEELMSLGNLGMLRAYNSFDVTKGVKFTSYCHKAITNEIIKHYNKNKKHKDLLSIDKTLYKDDSGNEVTALDILSDESVVQQYKDVHNNDIKNRVLQLFITNESEKLIKALESMILQGKRQREFGEEMGFSRAYAGTMKQKVEEKLQYYYSKIS